MLQLISTAEFSFSGVLDFLNKVDIELFKILNSNGSETLDWFMPLITDFHKTIYFQFFFLPLILILTIYKYRKAAIRTWIFVILTVASTDYISYTLIKKQVLRLRPPVAGIETIIRAPFAGDYSFTSNHAANSFGIAMFLSLCFPILRLPLFFFASLIAYSRVYVGVHYPGDVIIGAMIGMLVGLIWYSIFNIRVSKSYG